MTTVTIYDDKSGNHRGFELSGHADYAKKGPDIVCSAISIMTTTTINSIEKFVGKRYSYQENEADGYMKMMLVDEPNADTQLLMNSMILGLSQLSECYKRNVRLKTEEV